GLLAGCASTSETDDQAERDAQAAAEAERQAAAAAAERQNVSEQDNEVADLATTFYFAFDESTLRPDARAALTAHAERLRNNSESVRLEGHADERGSREYNMALGERRANSVRDFLVLQGVDSSRIE